jgi:hypothetical protein
MKKVFVICVAIVAAIWYRHALRRRVRRRIVTIPPRQEVEKSDDPCAILVVRESRDCCDVEIRDGRTGRRVMWSIGTFADREEAEDVLRYLFKQIKLKNFRAEINK